MFKLPKLPNEMPKSRAQVVALRGINYTDNFQDGDLADSLNVSTRRYPYLSTRTARTPEAGYSSITALTAWNNLIAVQDSGDGAAALLVGQEEPISGITPGEKQFAVVNTKLVIWPDQVYLDMTDNTIHKLGAPITGTSPICTASSIWFQWKDMAEIPDLSERYHVGETVLISGHSNPKNNKSVTIREFYQQGMGWKFIFEDDPFDYPKKIWELSAGASFTEGLDESEAEGSTFRKYDRMVIQADQLKMDGEHWTSYISNDTEIRITGCSIPKNNKQATVDFVLRTVLPDNEAPANIYFVRGTFSKGEDQNGMTLEAMPATVEQDMALTITKVVPKLDYICASDNRIWGCSSEDQSIYASALGDPTSFYRYEGLSTDSYTLPIGSDGDFTGCCAYGSAVLFWKEDKLHKIIGSTPAEFSLYDYNVEGLKKGCHKSQKVLNNTLLYMGQRGIYAYTGGIPSLIFPFGRRQFFEPAAGCDSSRYYISLQERQTEGGQEKHLLVYDTETGIWLQEDNLCCTDFARIGNTLYMLTEDGTVCTAASRDDEPELEWMAQYKPFYETIQGRKVHSKMILRVEVPKGSYMTIYIRTQGKLWQEIKKIVGCTQDAASVRIPLNRCDQFEVKIEGKGPCAILGMLREFTVGSDK